MAKKKNSSGAFDTIGSTPTWGAAARKPKKKAVKKAVKKAAKKPAKKAAKKAAKKKK